MALTEPQLEARRQYLGGTDMAAIAGLSPYAKPIDVWLDKRGEAEPRSNPMMSLGSLLEPVVAALFAEATGLTLVRPGHPVRDAVRPWLGGNIDRWVRRGRGGTSHAIFEAKWIGGRKDQWGETGTDRIPPGYAIQVMHYLGITGREVAYVAALFGYAEFRWYEIHRDAELIEELRELGRRFWHENVLAGEPPEPDGSESYGAYLRRRYTPEPGKEIVAGPEQHLLWHQWRDLAAIAQDAGQRLEKASQRLQMSMGSATRLEFGEAGHITWSPYEEKRIDWKATATALAEELRSQSSTPMALELMLAEEAAKHTTTTTKRPFRPNPPKEEASE